jgi:hypothetical protein
MKINKEVDKKNAIKELIVPATMPLSLLLNVVKRSTRLFGEQL